MKRSSTPPPSNPAKKILSTPIQPSTHEQVLPTPPQAEKKPEYDWMNHTGLTYDTLTENAAFCKESTYLSPFVFFPDKNVQTHFTRFKLSCVIGEIHYGPEGDWGDKTSMLYQTHVSLKPHFINDEDEMDMKNLIQSLNQIAKSNLRLYTRQGSTSAGLMDDLSKFQFRNKVYYKNDTSKTYATNFADRTGLTVPVEVPQRSNRSNCVHCTQFYPISNIHLSDLKPGQKVYLEVYPWTWKFDKDTYGLDLAVYKIYLQEDIKKTTKLLL